MRTGRCFGLLAIVFLWTSVTPAQSARAVREAAERELADRRYQTSFPAAEAVDEPSTAPPTGAAPTAGGAPARGSAGLGPESWSGPAGDLRRGADSGGPSGRGFAKDAARVLLYVALAVLLVVLATKLVAWWNERRANSRTEPSAAADVKGPPGRPAPIPDHERLAAEGRFAEAIHALFLLVLSDTGQELGRWFAPAATGREIAARDDLPSARAAAVRHLATAVERSRFGGRALSANDYRAGLGLVRSSGRPPAEGAA